MADLSFPDLDVEATDSITRLRQKLAVTGRAIEAVAEGGGGPTGDLRVDEAGNFRVDELGNFRIWQ